MAEELPPINQDILKEQKETTNALASVIVEMRKQGGAETINVNNYNTDNRSTSQSSTITSTNITDPASMSGASMTMS